MTVTRARLRPAAPEICFDHDDRPYLARSRCAACETVTVGHRLVCAKCGARKQMEEYVPAVRGRIHTYSIVYRSFPGVATPFVSAVVALDGGGSVQGTVRSIAPDPDCQLFGLPLRIVFSETEQTDEEDNRYLAYHFVPQTDGEGDDQ